jgi:uncharacterized protein (TIGR03067 family)
VAKGIGLALSLFLVVGLDTENPSWEELAQFEGVWRFALVEVEGARQPDAPFETNKLIVLKDGRYVIVQGPRITRGVIKLSPNNTPKHYDVAVTSGPAKGLEASGLYELDGDTCKVCLPIRGKERPTVLESKAGNGCLIHVFAREKQNVKDALIDVGRKELAGRWQAVSYVLNDHPATDDDMKKIQLEIDPQGTATARNDGKVFIAGTTKIDPTQEPMTIDISYTAGEPKGKTSLGIYKIEDGLLTICRAAPEKARPPEFRAHLGSGITLMTYKREKTAEK